MPKLTCKCGNVIPMGNIPNPEEWLLISDTAYDAFSGEVDAEILYESMCHLLVCRVCSRIWIYWDGFTHEPTPYAKE